MSTYTSEPGTRLAGRYRLVDQVWSGSGWIMWKAIDETLARPVTVLTFAAGFPRVPEVVTAARAASRLTDPRLAQVFDVEDSEEAAYVVMEWLAGQTLTDLLSDGPLDVGRAVTLISDAAQALAAAHAAGQAHLRLGPGSLRWTRSGGVKISGLGIESALAGAALADVEAADPALTDTHGLARLLYAALTGYWPSDEPGPLRPAPMSDHGVCTPRQVSADVPAALDDVVCRALFQRGSRHGSPLTTPRALADALADVAPPVPLPEPAPAAARPAPAGVARPEDTSGWVLPEPGYRNGTAPYRARYPVIERSPAARAAISVVIVLVLGAVGASAWMLSRSLHGGQPQAGRHVTSPAKPSSAASVLLKPVGITTFDVYGSGNEDSGQVNRALGGNAQQPWHTSFYLNYPKFGNLKPGEGLLLDMGKQVSLHSVTVQFGTSCCTSFQVEVGNNNAMVKSTLAQFTVLGSAAHGVGSTSVPLSGNATGRYVMIWLTSLPPLQGQQGKFEAFISNIIVHGAVAHGSG